MLMPPGSYHSNCLTSGILHLLLCITLIIPAVLQFIMLEVPFSSRRLQSLLVGIPPGEHILEEHTCFHQRSSWIGYSLFEGIPFIEHMGRWHYHTIYQESTGHHDVSGQNSNRMVLEKIGCIAHWRLANIMEKITYHLDVLHGSQGSSFFTARWFMLLEYLKKKI